jgi:haloalkane dehalogenase
MGGQTQAVGRRPAWVSDDLFPFASRFLEIDGHVVHYVDEGEGPPLLMLHGNPTWSFLYRDVIQGLRPAFRCIALDYPGFGLSTAAAGYGYTPEEHSAVVRSFMEALDLRGLTMMFQDWGGPVGLGAAVELPERMRAVIPLNSRAWPDLTPQQEKAARMLNSPLGAFLVRRFNLFIRFAVPRLHRRPLSREELAHYTRPMPTAREWERTLIFGQSITGAAPFLQRVKDGLPRLRRLPALIIWAENDGGFTAQDRELFEHFFPTHRTVLLPEAGHFLQEDAPEEIVRAVRAWWPDVERGVDGAGGEVVG